MQDRSVAGDFDHQFDRDAPHLMGVGPKGPSFFAGDDWASAWQNVVDNKQKHLEFIQQAVNRMASNLFLLKGWTVTLIAALFALAAKDSKDIYFLIAYLPAFMFWVLDGYFLSQERRFRALYDYVRTVDEVRIDYSMDTSAFKDEFRNSWLGAMFSMTLLIYYGGLVATMLIVMCLIRP